MRRLATALVAIGAAVGAALFVVLQIWPAAPRTRLLDLYVLFLAGLFMFGFVQATRKVGEARASIFDRALRRRRPPSRRPASLAKLEREVSIAAVTAFDFHARLRPTLREIAAYRLANRGVVLDSGSPAVRAALGDELWELLRPDRRPPDDRYAAGLPLARVRAVLDALEKI
jgi:hypothetical protein